MNTAPDQKLDVFVSVVVPMHDASGYIERFVTETAAVLSARFKDFEIVLVDNCSRDNTVEKVEQIQEMTKNVQLYCLVSRIDFESVFIVGLEQAIGDVVITMDPRLDPAARIPDLLEPLNQGAQIVYGQRESEKLGFSDRMRRGVLQMASWWVRRRFNISIDAPTFRLMSRKVINAFLDNSDRYELFSVIAGFTGFRHVVVHYQTVNICGSPVRRSLIEDVIRSLRITLLASKWPLRMFVLASIFAASVNFFYSFYVVILKLFVGGIAEGWTSLSLQISVMFFVLFMILGVLSDYVLRLVVYNQRRPHYLIARERSSLVLSRKQELNVTVGAGSERAPNVRKLGNL